MNLEQEVVMYADKFHSKSVPPKFLQVEAYTARAERFGGENKQRWLDLVAKYGVPDIRVGGEVWDADDLALGVSPPSQPVG